MSIVRFYWTCAFSIPYCLTNGVQFKQTMTHFSVQVQDREVRLQIENAKSSESGGGSGGGGGGSDTDTDNSFQTSVTVQKVWQDTDLIQHPDSVKVQLYRNGKPYGPSVTLNEGNGWSHTWNSLENRVSWTVDEVAVPEGYAVTVERTGNNWTIINTTTSGTPIQPPEPSEPTDPSNPGAPGEPTDPSDPMEPGRPDDGDPTTPGDPSDPGTPTDPADPSDPTDPADSVPQTPSDHIPQTGDTTYLALWVTVMCLSAMGFVSVWIKTGTGRKQKRHE